MINVMSYKRAFIDGRIKNLSAVLSSQLASGNNVTIKDIEHLIKELEHCRSELKALALEDNDGKFALQDSEVRRVREAIDHQERKVRVQQKHYP